MRCQHLLCRVSRIFLPLRKGGIIWAEKKISFLLTSPKLFLRQRMSGEGKKRAKNGECGRREIEIVVSGFAIPAWLKIIGFQRRHLYYGKREMMLFLLSSSSPSRSEAEAAVIHG